MAPSLNPSGTRIGTEAILDPTRLAIRVAESTFGEGLTRYGVDLPAHPFLNDEDMAVIAKALDGWDAMERRLTRSVLVGGSS